MLGSRDRIPRLQSDFYRDQYRRILDWLVGSLFIIFLLIAGIFYAILVQAPQYYYANTTEGKIYPMPIIKGRA